MLAKMFRKDAETEPNCAPIARCEFTSDANLDVVELGNEANEPVIHILVSEVGYEILSNQGKMADALCTFKWRRQKSKNTNRVIVQADQVRLVHHRGRSRSLASFSLS